MEQSDKVIERLAWQTTDGKLFLARSSADHHQKDLNDIESANTVLETGGTIAGALRAVGYPGNIPVILETVTTATQLVIPHWQCCDTPGYKPVRFQLGLRVRVFGHAGAWSGSYGSEVSIADLARYATHKDTVI